MMNRAIDQPDDLPCYLVEVWWEPVDEVYVASVPDLPGCMYSGGSYAEAAAGIEAAIRRWIADAKREGKSVPPPSASEADYDRYREWKYGGGKQHAQASSSEALEVLRRAGENSGLDEDEAVELARTEVKAHRQERVGEASPFERFHGTIRS
jgi:predicted RNase H-like HicB family nuclease